MTAPDGIGGAAARLARVGWILPLLLLTSSLCACEQGQVEVTAAPGGDAYGVYGRGELQAAVQEFSGRDRTPERYRALARAITTLQPRFDEDTAADAERSLTLLALEPLDASYDAPLDEQLERNALTVWPTVLGEEPRPEETAGGYAERLCRESLALHCKLVVPEYRALVLGALVWQRFLERARLAVNGCEECKGNAEYAELLARFERREADMTARASQAAKDAGPRRWPAAGSHAEPWPSVPVVMVRDDGTAGLAGRELPPGSWGDALKPLVEDAGRLGVFIEPSTSVVRLRALGQAAAAAGFRELAIQARMPAYPYPLRSYRVILSRRARKQRVPVRDLDSVQVLIQALDVAAGAGKPPLSL